MQPIDLQVFQDTIWTWLDGVFNSVAPTVKVIWDESNAPRPAYPYATIRTVTGPNSVSPLMESRQEFDAGRPAGEEIELNACVPCTFDITFEFFASVPEANDPTANAQFFCNAMLGSLGQDSTLQTLGAAGISVINKGQPQNIGTLINDSFVSRYKFDVTFGAALNMIEYTTYISKIQLVSEDFGIDTIISSD
jgi:hypothetical protein